MDMISPANKVAIGLCSSYQSDCVEQKSVFPLHMEGKTDFCSFYAEKKGNNEEDYDVGKQIAVRILWTHVFHSHTSHG